jgi:predicted nucleotidyltransferase
MHLSAAQTRLVAGIARRNGAVRVSLFGSIARGDACPDSDLDVLVEMESGRSLLDLARLERELRESLGFEVDVATPKSLHPQILARAMAERKPVL